MELRAQVRVVQHTAPHIEEHTLSVGGACSVCKVFTFTNYADSGGEEQYDWLLG